MTEDTLYYERATVGMLLVFPGDTAKDLLFHCGAQDFQDAAMRAAFTAVAELDLEKQPIDLVTIIQRIQRNHDGPAQALLDEVITTTSLVSTPANALYYAKGVAGRGRVRRLQEAAKAAGALMDAGADEITTALRTAIREAEGETPLDMLPYAQIIAARYAQLEQEMAGALPVARTMTGVHSIDSRGGMRDGEMWVLGARPGSGKTALAQQMCEEAAHACEAGEVVLFFSMEMRGPELAERALVKHVDCEGVDLRAGKIPDEAWAPMQQVVRETEGLPLYVVEAGRLMIEQAIAMCERVRSRQRIKLACFDYFQLFRTSRKFDTDTGGFNHISHELMALSDHCPVLVLSQLNRKIEERQNHYPQLADLRDCGSLEQDADVVLFVHRPYVFNPNKDPTEAELYFAKRRHGGTGRVELKYLPEKTRFIDA